MATGNSAVLVINCGSSSIKFALFAASRTMPQLFSGALERIGLGPGRFHAKDSLGKALFEQQPTLANHKAALGLVIKAVKQQLAGRTLLAVGHRVVHGGANCDCPVPVDLALEDRLRQLVPLAPLHLPHNLAGITAVRELQPDLPQVACFDTSFHRTNPEIAQRFALPAELHEAGIRRYGFHGLSYEYIASVLPQFDAKAAAGKTVVLHLGNGASMCAIEGCKSVASTMGFTAVEGLPMGTRSGSLDPGVILYLMDSRGMDARAVEQLIYNQSGLLGVSGISSDMRTLLASDDARAKLAVDLYCYRIRRELGSLAAALGGLDAIVFTAGIGENAAAIRSRVCRDASWLGVALDAAANLKGGPRISTAGSRVAAWAIPTNEELMIARHTRALLGAS